MAKEKRPAIPFYVKDWLSDIKVRTMPRETRASYWDILCYMWLEPQCQIENNNTVIKGLGGCKDSEVPLIKKCFIEVKNGKFLTQKRLKKEWLK